MLVTSSSTTYCSSSCSGALGGPACVPACGSPPLEAPEVELNSPPDDAARDPKRPPEAPAAAEENRPPDVPAADENRLPEVLAAEEKSPLELPAAEESNPPVVPDNRLAVEPALPPNKLMEEDDEEPSKPEEVEAALLKRLPWPMLCPMRPPAFSGLGAASKVFAGSDDFSGSAAFVGVGEAEVGLGASLSFPSAGGPVAAFAGASGEAFSESFSLACGRSAMLAFSSLALSNATLNASASSGVPNLRANRSTSGSSSE
mmetsp:Transcript_74991/g.231628  ORF Transcript_74991/g.231628 Transcript_74991/m.231628 type:complete len:259 (-) Transcript_74991:222-998(-)